MSEQTQQEHGGPAFPETRWDDSTRQEVQWTGMSLRDWFAGQALNGILASSAVSPPFDGQPPWEVLKITYNQWAIQCAWNISDAMLKARNAKE